MERSEHARLAARSPGLTAGGQGADQSEAGPHSLRPRKIEPLPVVHDRQVNTVRGLRQPDIDMARVGMLADVTESLLRDWYRPSAVSGWMRRV